MRALPTDADQQEQLWLVPNGLGPVEQPARIVREALRASGIRVRMLTPRSPAGSLLQSSRVWAETGSQGWSGRIDRRLLERHLHGVIAIAPNHRKGPFPLDLASRFLHPLDRMRLLASGDRARLIADIAAAAPIDAWTIGMPLNDSTLWLRTDDVVAAELWSLVLAEQFFDHRLEMRGPWEDPAVQRATELNLGVRIPSDMLMILEREPPLPDKALQLIETGRHRLGMAP